MSSEAILRAIAEASDREVEVILGDARPRADALVADAQRSAGARVAEGLAASEPELAATAARGVNAARLRLLHCRAERRAERMAAVFRAAEQRLLEMAVTDPARHASAMGRLAAIAATQAGAGSMVNVRRSDLASARAGIPGHATVADDATMEVGVVARSADGRMRVDATLVRRLERARTLLADRVLEVLERGNPAAPGG